MLDSMRFDHTCDPSKSLRGEFLVACGKAGDSRRGNGEDRCQDDCYPSWRFLNRAARQSGLQGGVISRFVRIADIPAGWGGAPRSLVASFEKVSPDPYDKALALARRNPHARAPYRCFLCTLLSASRMASIHAI